MWLYPIVFITCLLGNIVTAHESFGQSQTASTAKLDKICISDLSSQNLKRKKIHRAVTRFIVRRSANKVKARQRSLTSNVRRFCKIATKSPQTTNTRCSAADINLNLQVDQQDLRILLDSFGLIKVRADINLSGRVDLEDLAILLSCWGSVVDTSTPTPLATVSATATRTPTPTSSNTPQLPTITATATITSTITSAPIQTATRTATRTPTRTVTRTPTPSSTPTSTGTVIPVVTSTPTATRTITPTPTITTTPNPSGEINCNGLTTVSDDFSASNIAPLGTTTNLTHQPSIGVIPNLNQNGHPFVESQTLLQAEFESASALGADSSQFGIPLTCTNCPTMTPNGRLGNAAQFSGSQYFTTSAQLDIYRFSNTDFTWAAWFKTSSSANQYILGSYCGFGHFGAELRVSNGQINLLIDPSAGSETILNSQRTGLHNNAWHHVAVTRNTSTGVLKIYIDGALDSQLQGPVNGGGMTCGTLAIGSGSISQSSGTFQGAIDELVLSSRALSDADISRLATTTRTTGSFISRSLSFSNPVYQLNGNVQETNSGRTELEVSVDGNHWCALSGLLTDPQCRLPSSQLRYRLNVLDPTTISAVNLAPDCSTRCIDYDGDGQTSDPNNSQYCSDARIDCNDANRFIHHGSSTPACACGAGSPPIGQEICGDGLDNDCDGATDTQDNSCYNQGRTFYISSRWGQDWNDGRSPQAPLRSLELLQSIINAGLNPGDRVLIERGSIFTTGNIAIQSSGTASDPIVFSTYGEGGKPELRLSGSITAITFSDSHYITLEGLHLTRTSNSQNVSGVQFDPLTTSEHVTLRDLHVDRLAYGLVVKCHNFVLENSLINDNENSQVPGHGHSQGFYNFGGSDYGIIRNNEFRNNGKYHVIFDHNVYLGGGNYWTIEGNSFSGDSGTSIVFHGVQRGNIVRNNDFFDNYQPAIDVSDYATGQLLQDFIVEKNRIFSNDGGGFWIRGAVNLIVRNNLFFGNDTIFSIGSGVDHPTTMTVEHNTFFQNSGLISSSSGDQVLFRYNIFDGSSASGSGSHSFQTNYTLSSTPIFTAPGSGDFTPLAGSPVIDAAIGSTLIEDLLGLPRPVDGNGDGVSRSDIGAFERQ